MDFPVNRPIVLKAAAGTLTSIRVTTCPPQPGFSYGAGVPQVLTFNDAATLAAAASGNQVWSAPIASIPFFVGQTITMSYTATNGITVSSVPPGVSCVVTYA